MGIKISEEKRQSILAAADHLDNTGAKVTMSAIKEHMGGGSFSYISPVLSEWKQDRKPRLDLPQDIPDELSSMLKSVILSVWGETSKLANERIEEARIRAEGDVRDKEEQLAELATAMSDTEDALTDSVQQFEDLSTRFAEKEKARQESQELLGKTQTALQNEKEAHKDVQRERTSLQEQLSAAKQAAALAEEYANTLNNKVAELELKRNELDDMNKQLVDQAEEHQKHAGDLSKQLKEVRQSEHGLRADKAELQDKVTGLSKEAHQQAEELKTTHRNLGEATEQADTAHKKACTYEEQLKATETELIKAVKTTKEQAGEIEHLKKQRDLNLQKTDKN